MSHSRKKKVQVVYKTDWRSVISLAIVSFFVMFSVSKLNEHGFFKTNAAQVTELLEVPELLEEVDTPEAEVQPIPEQPAENPTATFQPPTSLREIQIEGPVDAIVGDAVHLRVLAEGPAVNYAWSITPDSDGLFVLDDGSAAIFTNRNAGTYVVYVSATDGLGNIEQDTRTFELIQQKDTLTLQNLSQANPDPSVPELIDYYVAEVRSPTKESEVIIVSQTFRQTANLLRTGAINAGDNIFGSMMKGLEVSMSPQKFAPWQVFFDRLQVLLGDYSAKGYLRTRDEWVNTLDNLATILESRSSRKPSP
jgi:hypothetical protein